MSIYFYTGHPSSCEVLSHGGFDLGFPNDSGCWASFHTPDGHCRSFLEKWLFKSFAYFPHLDTVPLIEGPEGTLDV